MRINCTITRHVFLGYYRPICKHNLWKNKIKIEMLPTVALAFFLVTHLNEWLIKYVGPIVSRCEPLNMHDRWRPLRILPLQAESVLQNLNQCIVLCEWLGRIIFTSFWRKNSRRWHPNQKSYRHIFRMCFMALFQKL